MPVDGSIPGDLSKLSTRYDPETALVFLGLLPKDIVLDKIIGVRPERPEGYNFLP